MKEEKQQEKPKPSKNVKLPVALKDFKFCFGKTIYDLKKGEEVNVPKMFLANLKTEKVIK